MNRKLKTDFTNYQDFYKFYLKEHSKASTRIFHCVGTLVGLLVLGYAIALGHPRWALAGLLFAYALAWGSHLFVEKNRPATFRYPLFSFISDFRMLFETLIGKLPLNKDLK